MPGPYKWDATRPDRLRNFPYRTQRLAYIPFLLGTTIAVPIASKAIEYLVNALPYWEKRRAKVEKLKLNFDLAIDCNAGPLDMVKQKSVF